MVKSGQIADFLPHVTLKFQRRPWKIIGHLFYVASIFVHHFKAIAESKLELQPDSPNSGQNRRYFLSPVTLKFDKFDEWPWKSIGHHFYAVSSFVRHFIAIVEFKPELVWKHLIWVEIDDYFSSVTLTFDGWP